MLAISNRFQDFVDRHNGNVNGEENICHRLGFDCKVCDWMRVIAVVAVEKQDGWGLGEIGKIGK
jgi:hypothetical protein